MKQQVPQNSPEARKAARARRRRRLRMMRLAIVLTILLVLALVIALVVLRAVGVAASKRGETTSFLAVNKIVVEGETRYTNEELLQESGIYVGQSLLAVNKVQAHDRLLRAFPYLEWVEVGNSSFDTIRIRVREATVLGAVKTSQDWMVLGSNNQGLEHLSEDALPANMLRIEGAALEGEAIGEKLLDERSLGVASTIIQAAADGKLEGMTAINMAEKTNIRLWWKGRLEVVLGNESNLTEEVKRLPAILESLVKNNGETVEGRLDMSSYADDNPDNDKAIYTPKELLSVTPPTDSTTSTDTTAAQDGTTASTAA